MSQVLPRRVLVAVAILTLLGAALALAVATRPQTAQAQAGPAHDTEVFSNIVLATNSIGEIHLGPGTGSVDVLGAGCNPAGPRGGGGHPPPQSSAHPLRGSIGTGGVTPPGGPASYSSRALEVRASAWPREGACRGRW